MAVDPLNAKRIHDMDQALAGARQVAQGAMAFFAGVLEEFETGPILLTAHVPREQRILIACDLTRGWLTSVMAAAIHLRKEGTE